MTYMNTGISEYPDVIIVGAGSSGLTAGYYLQKQGLRILILEGQSQVAVPWHSRHPQLRLNTHRILSHLPGGRLPWHLGPFVSRDDFIAHLQAYARWLSSLPGVELRYGVEVEAILQQEEHWQLHTSSGELTAEYVVVATGPERQPFVPNWPSQQLFCGKIRHAAHFGDVEQYRGMKVLIVGGGNSGIDIANHLLKAGLCRELWIAMRHGTHLLPTWFLGIPVQLTTPLLRRLPLSWQDALGSWMAHTSFGDLSPWQLHTPAKGSMTRLWQDGVVPAFDDGFVAGLKNGRIRVLTEVARFETDGVVLTGGERVQPDVVICATGYRTGLETLVGHLGVLSRNGIPIINAPAPALPGLWLFGMTPHIEGHLVARRREARRLAKQIGDQWIRRPLPQ